MSDQMRAQRPVYRELAALLMAAENCKKTGNTEWHERHSERIASIVADCLPSGSGWDNGTALDSASTPERLVFHGSFHHMDDGGGYDGWTDHSIIVTPSLAFDFNLRVTGRDRNEIKDYIGDMFQTALSMPCDRGAAVAS